MRITYIKLIGFKRFPLRESDTFEHTFVNKTTMIAGPNGAGKSSLFGELTPLPSDKNNFNKGGYKEIHVVKDDINYVLISNFKEATRYSFVRDGVELNVSGNVTAQKELCAIHFSITQAIHELMTGSEAFTDMGLLSRKKLFNSITHLNIDSILGSYEKLKEELKNNEYLVKVLQSKLLTEQRKLMEDGRKTQLNERLTELKTHIDHLLAILTELHRYKDAGDIDTCALAYKRAISDLNNHYKNNIIKLSGCRHSECDSRETELKETLAVLLERNKQSYSVMERLLDEKKVLEFARGSDRKTLSSERDALLSGMGRVIADLSVVDKDTSNLQAVMSELNILDRSLPVIVESMPENIDRKLSKTVYAELMEEKGALVSKLYESLSEYSKIVSDLKQLKTHQKSECPSCSHSWLPVEVSGLIESNEARLLEVVDLRGRLDSRMTVVNSEIIKQETYLSSMRELTALYSATKLNLSGFWSIVNEKAIIYSNPSGLLPLVAKGINEVFNIEKHRDMIKRVEVIDESIQMLDSVGTTSLLDNLNQIKAEEAKVSDIMTEIENVKEQIETVLSTRRLHVQLEKMKAIATSASKDLKNANLRYSVETLVTEIGAELSLSKVTLMEVQNELSQHDAISQTVKTIEDQVSDAEENIKVLTILTNELSPKNGFIAKTISSFLNIIIHSVNSVIAGVWGYKMELKAIDVETDSLNYKFKLVIEDRLTVDDISKASTGMKEMINLAMKVTLFKLLKLENYPMHLDEMGSHLDTLHTEKIVNMVYRLTMSDLYSQVFLISHKDNFSFLKNTEIIEL